MADQPMNPDDPRPTYIRIADQLRQDYEPGGQLPSAPKLAEQWGVAKETVRSAIDVLRKEGLVISWQGRGTFYRTQADTVDAATSPTDEAILGHIERIMSRLDEFDDRLAALERSRGSANGA
ncbi:GntR family transcriptional regulator [Micromonospora purpureochromogenes]|uniref:winged helix-turn-helix domain-containing protein n=1 Tax=Micromonospora purpureochromogenes TaxID=47872 RepID=UPI00341172DF